MNRTARIVFLAAAIAAGAALDGARSSSSADAVAPVAERAPMPDAAAQQKAMKTVDEVYREEAAAARTPELKQALARKWLKAGTDTSDDPAARFVLLAKAKDLACEAGDVATALEAAQDLERQYLVDVAALDADVAARLARTTRSPEDLRALFQYVNGAINDALLADRFDAARRLGDAAYAVARSAGDPTLSKQATTRVRDVREVEAAWTQLQKAGLTSLAAPKAGDPAANAQVGRYRCLLKGDWASGLPFLAAGNDEALKTLAKTDINGAPTAEAMSTLADGYWEQADKAQQGLARTHLQLRARKWYAEAARATSGLTKAKAQRRVQETDALAPIYGPKELPVIKPVESAASGTQIPQGRFVREWKSPPVWVGKPEQVVVKGTKITITNQGGTNTVVADADLVREKDGSVTISWDDGKNHGYEQWVVTPGKDIVINRWDFKAEKEAGKPPKKVGFIVSR